MSAGTIFAMSVLALAHPASTETFVIRLNRSEPPPRPRPPHRDIPPFLPHVSAEEHRRKMDAAQAKRARKAARKGS